MAMDIAAVPATPPAERLPTRHVVVEDCLALRPSWWPSHQASSTAVLPGRAPDVPYTSVRSGHPRTTTVYAHALRAVGSARTERSEGASQARDSSSAGIDLARRGRQMRSLVADGAERPTAFAAGGTAKTVRGAEPPGRGDQLRRCRAPGRAASGRSHRARSAAPRRSTLLRGIPQPRRSLAGHGSSMV